MATYRQVVTENGRVLIERAIWCDDFWSKLRGLTFRRRLAPGEGLVLVEKADSRITTAIHMFFVFCKLGVIWVNDAGAVVDMVLARPWRPSYAPLAPARYVIEGAPDLIDAIALGDQICFQSIDI